MVSGISIRCGRESIEEQNASHGGGSERRERFSERGGGRGKGRE